MGRIERKKKKGGSEGVGGGGGVDRTSRNSVYSHFYNTNKKKHIRKQLSKEARENELDHSLRKKLLDRGS